MAQTIPLRRMVLYKHGIGYFTRQGVVRERKIGLRFRAGEVDDALKSVTAFSSDGGRVTGIHYATPEERSVRLETGQFDGNADHDFFSLIRAIRGAPVTVHLRDGEPVQGRVIGVEEHPQGRKHGATFVLLTGSGTVEQVSTDRVTRLEIEDQRVARDVSALLDAAANREEERTVTIALSEPGHTVQVSYAAPSPVWRVSYRLVGTSSEEGGPADRRALLQGWGIFDNRLEEDLQDVEVPLVAGQPVSFRYDLTSSVIPERHVVQDDARIAAGPVEFDAPAPAMVAAHPAFARRLAEGPEEGERGRLLRSVFAPTGAALAESTAVPAVGRELEELFEYRVGDVSVGRGESAMVPIVQHEGRYRRELLYNGAKQPGHPVVGVRLANATGLTLERGPVTVVEDGQYRGEAILPFTRAESEIVLAFAVELGVAVHEATHDVQTVTAIHLDGAYANIQESITRRVTYTLVNRTGEQQEVTVDQPKWGEAELMDTRAPDEETAEHRRWRVTCPPRVQTVFEASQRLLIRHSESILDQNLDRLSEYLANRFLDGDTREALQSILRLRQRLAEIDRRLEGLRAEQVDVAARQDRLRKNLSIEAANEQEVEIRRRSADDFRRTQDREDAIEREREDLEAERRQVEEDLRAEVSRLE